MNPSTAGRHGRTTLALITAFLCWPLVAASGAELKVLSIGSVRAALPDLFAAFEKETGNKVAVTYDAILPVASRIEKGEAFDVVVGPRDRLEALGKEGKVKADSIATLVHVPLAVGVPPGAAKPDVSSGEALKRAILAAAAITYPDPANGTPTGLYFPPVLAKLGLADSVKGKTKFAKSGTDAVDITGRGEAALGFASIGDFKGRGADLIGPLPADLKSEIDYSAAAVTASHEPQAALALAKYLTSPAAAPLLKAKGLTP